MSWRRGFLQHFRVFDYTLDPAYRCRHVNRFGVRCFRAWIYQHFCGLHNSTCFSESTDGVRHDWFGGGHH